MVRVLSTCFRGFPTIRVCPVRTKIPTCNFNSPRSYSSVVEKRVGFVGLGNMGSPMAMNLARSGRDMLVYDANPSSTEAVALAAGAHPAASLQEVAENCGVILTMLPSSPHVESVYLGKGGREGGGGVGREGGGLLRWVGQGTLLVDSSTIDPLTSKRVNAVAASKGAVMMDAPVSGGVPAAAAGTLTFIVGGTEEGLARARPLLEAMGTEVHLCGGAGAGCVAKICNNLSLAISMIGVSEAMSLGSRMGMDPKVLAGVINSSSGRSWSSDSYNPFPGVMEGVPSSRGYKGGFSAALMEKDLHLALQAGRESFQSLPMGALAHQLYSIMCGHGAAHKDFSGIHELISGSQGQASGERQDPSDVKKDR